MVATTNGTPGAIINPGPVTAPDPAASWRGQTIQYNAIWCYFGHGGYGRAMSVWNGGNPAKSANYGADDQNWSYILAHDSDVNVVNAGLGINISSNPRVSLDKLPAAERYNRATGQTQMQVLPQPLYHEKFVGFFGCYTADWTSPDNVDNQLSSDCS